jgi:hypothetical protein
VCYDSSRLYMPVPAGYSTENPSIQLLPHWWRPSEIRRTSSENDGAVNTERRHVGNDVSNAISNLIPGLKLPPILVWIACALGSEALALYDVCIKQIG